MRTILKIGVVLGMFLLMPGLYSYTQVSINTDGSEPDSSAMLDVKSNNKGFLPPRIALSNINSSDPITSPAIGLLIYNTANSGNPPNNVMKGYYYWNGTQWISLVPIPGDTTWTDNGFSAKKQISKRDTIQSKILRLTTIPTKIDTSHKFLSPSSNGLIEQSDASKLFGIDYNNLTNNPKTPDINGWIYDTSNPVYPKYVMEASVVIENDTAFLWYRESTGADTYLQYTYATNSTFDNWVTPMNTNLKFQYFNYVFKVGSIYYMAIQYLNSDIYLFYSTNRSYWSLANSGNPLLTHSSNSSDPNHILYNPSICVVGNTWYMIQDGRSMTGDYTAVSNELFSYTTFSSNMNFNTNLSGRIILSAGCPDLKYIPSRNAFLLIYSDISGNANGKWRTNARYASLSDDLTQASSWHLAPSFPVQEKDGIHISDPYFVETPNKKYKSMIIVCYDQLYLYQAFSEYTLQDFYDHVIDSIKLGGVSTMQLGSFNELFVNGNSQLFGSLHVTGNTSIGNIPGVTSCSHLLGFNSDNVLSTAVHYGINNPVPNANLDIIGKLQVQSTSSLGWAGSGLINLYDEDSPSIYFYNNANTSYIKGLMVGGGNELSFGINSSEKVRILSNGGLRLDIKTTKSGTADSCLRRDPADSILKMQALPTSIIYFAGTGLHLSGTTFTLDTVFAVTQNDTLSNGGKIATKKNLVDGLAGKQPSGNYDSTWTDNGFAAKKQTSLRDTVQMTIAEVTSGVIAPNVTLSISDTAVAVKGKEVFISADSSFYDCRSTTSAHKWWKRKY